MIEFGDDSIKPTDWPKTYKEARLSRVLEYIGIFKKDPSYKNKEILFGLVNQSDLNESDSRGIYRTTDYELMIINSIYLEAWELQSPDIKIYLYRHIISKVFNNKWASIFLNKENDEEFIKQISGLYTPLKVFALTYHYYIFHKDKKFSSKLIEIINALIDDGISSDSQQEIIKGFNILLYDLSFNNSPMLNEFLNFDRKELLKVFDLQSLLLKKSGLNPNERPLSGIVRLTITNWVLRSRFGYNNSFLHKCISTDSTNKISKNNEVWMQKIQYLNDKREGKVAKEIFSNKKWIKHEWVKNVDLDLQRTSFVSSFVKEKPTELMKRKYGKNIYSYKNDILRSSLSPVYRLNNNLVMLSYVHNYDIIYSREEFKDEVNFLCDIINSFHIDDDDKNNFFNSIIKYWLLSVKDKKWEYENERRYEIFIDENLEYIGSVIDERFLKVKSLLFTYPDFIGIGSNNHQLIKKNRLEKLKAISTKPFVFCNDCLFSDFDFGVSFDRNTYKCKNCSSESIFYYDENRTLF
ncbi:MAG: hypothetical protein PHF05_05055 [Candidatus Izemoplasmatales bacterium]|nr:hypothetical protein [Candidatus Izemoplasmatales bacterium]MDD4069806.1 hypothetical protein [Candidatus Izemoplasmatales bacterium]